MTQQCLLSYLASHGHLNHVCEHTPHFIEAYDLMTGELSVRTPIERQHEVLIQDTYQPHTQMVRTETTTASSTSLLPASTSPLTARSQSQSQCICFTHPKQCPLCNASANDASTHTHSQSSSTRSVISTHPTAIVVTERFFDNKALLPASAMVGGWHVAGASVCRVCKSVRTKQLLPFAPLPNVLWEITHEYSGDVFERADIHECSKETTLCHFTSKHVVQPSLVWAEYMRDVAKQAAVTLIDNSGYTRFDPTGAGWESQHLFHKRADFDTPVTTESPLPAQSILHCNSNELFILTADSIAAYNKYTHPNILDNYSYSRPPFQFPAVQGYLYELPIDLCLPDLSDESDDTISQLRQLQISDESQITTATRSPSGSPLAYTPSDDRSPVLGPISPIAPLRSLYDLENDAESSNSPQSEPIRAKHKRISESISLSVTQHEKTMTHSIPLEIFFRATWSLQSQCYRYSIKSLISTHLQCEVPAAVAPWTNAKSVTFAVAFMPNDNKPMNAIIIRN